MELDSLYQEVILDHYKWPKSKELKPNPAAQAKHVNTSCGDEITLNLHATKMEIETVTWTGVGCSISQASASVLSELMAGRSIDDALALIDEYQAMLQSKGSDAGDESRLEDGVAFAGVAKFPARVKCALLAWMALKDAIVQVQTGKN